MTAIKFPIRERERYSLFDPSCCPHLHLHAAAELGRLGGRKTAERGPEYYAEIQAQRKIKAGGRPKNPPKATHRGPLYIGNTELQAFVLEDGRRVVSGRGLTRAIGMKGRGQGVARISSILRKKSPENNDLALAIENPLIIVQRAYPKKGETLMLDLTEMEPAK